MKKNEMIVAVEDGSECPEEISLDVERAYGKLRVIGSTHSVDVFVRNYEALASAFHILECKMRSAGNSNFGLYQLYLERLAATPDLNTRIFILSFLVKVSSSPTYLRTLLETIVSAKSLTRDQKFFLLYQCSRYMFLDHGLIDPEVNRLMRRLYRGIYTDYQMEICDYKYIPLENRDRELVIVITGQFLGLNHAPTKTALDRCYHLMELGKRVLLINTADALSPKELFPFYNIAVPNHIKELKDKYTISYKDTHIGFYQSDKLMPDIDEIRDILGIVARHRPFFVMGIGSLNLTADLCSNLVPVVSVPLGFSSLPITESQFHVAATRVPETEMTILNELGFNEDNLVDMVFTFDFKPQEHVYSRQALGLPEDKFLLAIVGGRLDDEISEDFIEMLMSTARVGTYIVFVGPFSKYPELIEKHPGFGNHAISLGMQDDVLAILKICDLYVNPERLGGGSSVAEAMYQGLPAVTLGIGDVAVNTGPEFWVDSIEDMKAMIERYVADGEFYQTMAVKARERARVLTNTRGALAGLLRGIEGKPLFQ